MQKTHYGRSNIALGVLLSSLLLTQVVSAQNCNQGDINQSTPSVDFIVDPTDTSLVTHIKTGLTWMRCSLGQTWDGKTCNGETGDYDWQTALKLAREARFSGKNDWRLPNKNELNSIVEINCEKPSINLDIFPNTPSLYYWTSSPFVATNNMAWSIHFNNAFVFYELKAGAISVRLVRGG